MAKLEGRATVQLSVVISLTEQEAGALDALAGYGVEEFLKIFYQHMGESYLRPYEEGLRSLFHSIRNGPCTLKHLLDRATDARRVFDGEKVAKYPK